MNERSRLIRLCLSSLEEKGLVQDLRYKTRMKSELKEIDAQSEHEYLLNLYDKFRAQNLIFPENEHNNLIDWLLGIAPNFEIEKPNTWIQGEFPDIDIDYIKPVRDYLKGEWAAQAYGQEKICEIGTYGTAGIKSSILDMARVHGANIHEIQSITSQLEDKDDDGKPLEWEKIFEIATFQICSKEEQEEIKQEIEELGKDEDYDWIAKFSEKHKLNGIGTTDTSYVKFAVYCLENPEIADAAKLFQGRNTHSGVHAGGLIVSNQRLDGFVPLEVRKVNKEHPNGVICSAWSEGLAHQDLAPVGLIKFDLLVINNLMQIALAVDLVKKRHGITSICAREGDTDWSDTVYLNDPKAIEMANKADLRCIFQFDGEGIRKLVKRGGVTSFEDLVAYSALYRPGPLNMGMDARYCKRKKWADGDHKNGEPYNIHPIMETSLGKTYGVLVYQEQVMDMLRVVGLIPDMHTEKVRKAISKKKIAQFAKYKEQFIINGQKVLGCTETFVRDLWDQIEAFAEYGFNRSHACAYTFISSRLLYLKAHYPLEFYTATLMCEKDQEKFREYKLDAKYHGVDVCPVDINKSRMNFNIADDKIYFGFKNIKGIGEAVADRVVENQPYKDFPDFLTKFGTDAAALMRLVSLGVFDDLEPHYDREHLRRFHEFFKDKITKRRQRQQRFESSMEKKNEELRDLLLSEIKETDPDFEAMCQYNETAEKLWEERFEHIVKDVPYKYKGEDRVIQVSVAKMLSDLSSKRDTSARRFEENEKDDDENPMSLDEFNPSAVKLDDEEIEVLNDFMVVQDQKSYPKAESLYYGFQWNHELEASPDFNPDKTIDSFLEQCELSGEAPMGVQIKINSVKKRVSKNNVTFYTVEFEDANSRQAKMNVWSDDYTRWHEELKKDAILSVRMRPPSGGYNTFTFESVPKRERHLLGPKEEDFRIVKMTPAPKGQKLDDSILLDDLKFEEPGFIDLGDM